MSSDYYFHKWHAVLQKIQLTVDADVDYQSIKTHEQKECSIVQRLSEILGGYTSVYNEAVECLHQNLQVQKNVDIHNMVQAISKRILELKHQLTKLQASNFQFITRGLVDMKLTTHQTEFKDIPEKIRRSPAIEAAIDDVWIKARELKEKFEEEERERQREIEEAHKPPYIDLNIWDDVIEEKEENKEEQEIDEETKQRRMMINRIIAQDKCRFARCTKAAKITLFKAYCQSFYTCGLSVGFTQQANSDLRVKYNNAFRVLLVLPWRCSESGVFAEEHTDGFAAIMRKRQVIKDKLQKEQTRNSWTKMLQGTNKPQARLELKVKAAKMIQKCMRAYFESKRKRIEDCQRDAMLGIIMSKKPIDGVRKKYEENTERREKLLRKYEEERKSDYEKLRQHCLNKESYTIKEDYRSQIRDWFKKWYNEAWFFIDIPKADYGGSTLILKEEIPSPSEWKDMNDAYIAQQKANKGKTAQQLKQEKKGENQEQMLAKKAEAQKKKQEEILLQKMMKNPKMHPGFKFPPSKETEKIVKAIRQFHVNWDYLDSYERKDVKEKYVKELDDHIAWAEVKEQLRPQVDDHMREVFKDLKTCLKEEYETFEEEWPKATVPLNFPKVPKTKLIKTTIQNDVIEKMIDLAMKGFMKQYPKTKFEDFKGEPNFAGDDLRCNFRHALPYGGETKNLWWEQCRQLSHGFSKLLLVGPKTSGKKLLVYAMATVNNAILFELEVSAAVFDDMETRKLQALINSISACAKAAQPAIVYIKYVHRLFYRKVPPQEPALNAKVLNTYLIKKLGKKFHKTDKITIIGSCQDPWQLKSGPLLKQFPTVVMMPNTTYTTTGLILREWVMNNRIVPRDLDVSCLAQVLQGYRFGYLKQALQDFLSAERIIRIAARGLRPQEIFEVILADDSETKVEYDKYLKWYTDTTHWGNQEKKHLEAQLEFEALAKKYEEKTMKKGGASAASSAASSVASLTR